MAYIYQITNDINGKVYIGKTEFSIERRFQEHCRDFQRQTEEHRPLYIAMRKYGIEHFHVELLEETDNPEEREIYWIQVVGSFKNGYNATRGGDGRRYIDYDAIIKEYEKCHNQKEVALKFNINERSVRNILKSRDIEIRKSPTTCKAVNQLSLTGEYIQSFFSCGEASRYIESLGVSKAKISTIAKRIAECANGVRKTAYKYRWEFI